MEISLSGKRALVTGAAQGIGLGIVKKLVECGAQVVALDVQGDKLKEAVKELPGVETFVVDLNDWDSTEKLLKTIGSVQLVVNNAGIFSDATLLEMQEDAVNRILGVNLKGVMAVCKHVVNDWTLEGIKGAIVNIASIGATRAFTPNPVYCASKAAVVQYSRCLALDCAPKGIRVNCVSPGTVDTEMSRKALEIPEILEDHIRSIPMPERLLDPEDIGNSVAFLLCDKVAGRITGVNLPVDAGYSLT